MIQELNLLIFTVLGRRFYRDVVELVVENPSYGLKQDLLRRIDDY